MTWRIQAKRELRWASSFSRRSRVVAVSQELQAWIDGCAPLSSEDKLRGVPLFRNPGAANAD